MNEPRTNETTPIPERPRHRRWLVAAVIAAAALLVVTPVAAHAGVFGPASGSGHRATLHGSGYDGVRCGAIAPLALQRLPLGTEVTVEVYDGDPADGAQPVATLSATVGETSEAAFADEVQAATADAAFVTVATGPRTERLVLDGAELRGGPLGDPMRFGGLERGQTVEIRFYEDADDAAPSATSTFTYGEDSAAAFHQRTVEAAAQAAVAEVTVPAQERTVDLSATPWNGADDAALRPGYGMGRHVQPGAVRPGAMRPGSGFGPWGTPGDPPTD